jgi:hypothetical protein
LNKLYLTLPFALLLTAAKCTPDPAPPPETCTGVEQCGTVDDCPALCDAVARLGCSAAWGIDKSDGACLELCRTAEPGMCPLHASVQTTCAALDAATECQR